MRLVNYLLLRLMIVVACCLAGVIGWSLYNAHASIDANTAASAVRVQQQLQSIYWQKLLWVGGMSKEAFLPQPDWETLPTLNVISPGVCVIFAPPRGEARRLCSQVEALGPVAPAWFAMLDAWLFGEHRAIVNALSLHDESAGTVTTVAEPSAALRQSWSQASVAMWVAATLAAGISILAGAVIGLALEPVRTIIDRLRRLEQGDRRWRLPGYRTAEFNHMSQAINELAGTLTRMEAARAAMSAKLFRVQEEERRALARDLHDEFGQCLSATLALAALIELGSADHSEIAQDARTITKLQQRMMDTLRSALSRLRAQYIEEIGLEASLRQLIADYNAQAGSRALFHLQACGHLAGLPKHVAVHVYRIAQECLTNAVRHGSATQIRLSVQRTEGPSQAVSLTVEDNGGGDASALERSPGHGILGIRERVASLGGKLAIRQIAQGVQIAAVIPHAGCDAMENPPAYA